MGLGFLWIIYVCKSTCARKRNTAKKTVEVIRPGHTYLVPAVERVNLSCLCLPSTMQTSLLSWSQVFKMSPPTLATYRCWAQPERKAILCSVGKEKWTQLEFWGMVWCYPAYLLQGFSLVILTIPDWELYSVTPGLHRSGLCVGAFQSWTASWNPNWVSEFEFLSRLIFELVLFTLYCLIHLVTYMCG